MLHLLRSSSEATVENPSGTKQHCKSHPVLADTLLQICLSWQKRITALTFKISKNTLFCYDNDPKIMISCFTKYLKLVHGHRLPISGNGDGASAMAGEERTGS